jgi:hypothetical protein
MEVTNVMAMRVLQKLIGLAIAILFSFCIGIVLAITFAASKVSYWSCYCNKFSQYCLQP